MIETYKYCGYTVYPREGKICSPFKDMKEVAKGKPTVVIDIEIEDGTKRKRRIVKKIRAVYEAVYGPQDESTIIYPINGDYSDARLDNIATEKRSEHFENYDWSKKVRVSRETAEMIKKEYVPGKTTQAELARTYHCGKSTVKKIIDGEYYWDKLESQGEKK